MPVKRSARDDAGAARQAGESRAEARQSREAARAVRPERKPGQVERASAAGRNRGGLEIGRGTSSQSNRLSKKEVVMDAYQERVLQSLCRVQGWFGANPEYVA